jgi:hypothetical protein
VPTQKGTSRLVLSKKYGEGDEIRENEMGEESGTHVENEKCMQNFGTKT